MYPPNRYPCLEQILCLSESNIYIYISSIRFQTFSLPPFCSRACTYIKYFSKPKVFLSMKETAILFKVRSGGEENREHGRPWTCLLVSMASRWHPSIPPRRHSGQRKIDVAIVVVVISTKARIARAFPRSIVLSE